MAKKTAVCLNMKMQQTYQVNLEIGKCILEQRWVLLLIIYIRIQHKILFPFAYVE